MNVGELFMNLSYGELCNLAISGEGSGTIREQDQARVVSYARQVLTLLYSRFAHQKDFLVLRQEAGRHRYHLRPAHAVSDTGPAPKYIMDTNQDPYLGGLVKIIAVRRIDEAGDCCDDNLLINDDASLNSVKTMSYDTIHIAHPVHDEELLIEYQVNHPRLSLPVDLDDEIVLAPILEEALVLMVASKVYGNLNGESEVAKAVYLERSFEAHCALVEREDLLQLSASEDHRRFRKGGWI